MLKMNLKRQQFRQRHNDNDVMRYDYGDDKRK